MLIVAAVSFVIGGCSDNDEWNEQTAGGIQLSIPGISTEISETRSTPAQLPTPPIADFHVTIVRQSNGVTIYDGPFTSEKITAAPDDYTITCSYGMNAILDYDSPYYSGTVTATVVSTTEPTPVSVPVKVANSLVSVRFGDTEENIARFNKFYSDYALRVHVGDHFIDLNKDNTASSIYVAAGSQATLSFWGKLRAQNDREVTCELQSSSFPSTVKAAEHYIVTLSLPDPESALVVDIAKVELQTATLEETIPLSWLPVPKVEAKHHYESGVLTGTDLTFSNSYPGMSWKAVVTNAAGTVVRTVEGTGMSIKVSTPEAAVDSVKLVKFDYGYMLVGGTKMYNYLAPEQGDVNSYTYDPTYDSNRGGFVREHSGGYIEADIMNRYDPVDSIIHGAGRTHGPGRRYQPLL